MVVTAVVGDGLGAGDGFEAGAGPADVAGAGCAAGTAPARNALFAVFQCAVSQLPAAGFVEK